MSDYAARNALHEVAPATTLDAVVHSVGDSLPSTTRTSQVLDHVEKITAEAETSVPPVLAEKRFQSPTLG